MTARAQLTAKEDGFYTQGNRGQQRVSSRGGGCAEQRAGWRGRQRTGSSYMLSQWLGPVGPGADAA